MSAKGYVTVHWDRMQAGYNKQLDVDKDGHYIVDEDVDLENQEKLSEVL